MPPLLSGNIYIVPGRIYRHPSSPRRSNQCAFSNISLLLFEPLESFTHSTNIAIIFHKSKHSVLNSKNMVYNFNIINQCWEADELRWQIAVRTTERIYGKESRVARKSSRTEVRSQRKTQSLKLKAAIAEAFKADATTNLTTTKTRRGVERSRYQAAWQTRCAFDEAAKAVEVARKEAEVSPPTVWRCWGS